MQTRPRVESRSDGAVVRRHARSKAPSDTSPNSLADVHGGSPADAAERNLNPRTSGEDMEFFGTVGAVVVMFLIHATVLVIAWGSDA